MNQATEAIEAIALRRNAFPVALRYQNTRFGLNNEWWALLVVLLILMFVLGAWWPFLVAMAVIILILGGLISHWDEHALPIYRQYSKQHDRYEPGYFSRQTIHRRPEGMGREIAG